jgi:hypothetical protein
MSNGSADTANPSTSTKEVKGQSRGSAAGKSYQEATGETLSQTLDINTWDPAQKMAERFERLQAEIIDAQVREMENRRDIREHAFPLISQSTGAPKRAGVYEVQLSELKTIQSSLLFSGHVQAVDGASVVHQTLPVTVVQTGVALANYLGEHGTWGHRIFQKDVKISGKAGLDKTLELLANRQGDQEQADGGISDMLRRGLMANAELAVLAKKAEAPWRMGHGHPLPKELLTGANVPELIELSLPHFDDLLLSHRRFVYVPKGTSDRLLQTIGDALLPLEFAIIRTLDGYMSDMIDQGHYGDGRFQSARRQLGEFQASATGKLVAGAFRVSPFAPSQIFYAHADFAPEAAMVAMSDALLVETKGFPMLLDIAGTICREMFPPDAIFNTAAAARAAFNSRELGGRT